MLVKRYRPTVVDVDLEAIRHNVRRLMPSGGAALMAVVKADGYGHGDAPIARAALEAGATWLGVALVEEGLRLRDAGIHAPILVLSELPRGSELDALAAGLTPSAYTDVAVDALAATGASLGRRIGVHVKVDTGMHRVGVFPPEDAPKLVGRAIEAGLDVEALWTHFARSEDEDTTTGQLRRFLDVAAELSERPRLLHAANSGATIRHPDAHLDLVRPGIAIYGIEPAPGVGTELGLRPALTLRSSVTMVNHLPAGEALSYGHAYRLEREANVATVPVGYADGYARALSSRADALIRGRRCRVAGAVTMDQLLLDCGDGAVEPGDEVVLIGAQGDEEITAAELAAIAGTIPYEIVAAIGTRVPRKHRGA